MKRSDDDLLCQGYIPPRPQATSRQQPPPFSPQYTQPPQYAQPPQYQAYPPQGYQQPMAYPPQVALKPNRNKLLLFSGVVAVVWFIVVVSSFASIVNSVPTGGDNLQQAAYELGVSIGLMTQIPFLILAFLGTIFNWLAWFLSKKGFALTAGILFCIAFFFSLSNGLGYIPCLILCFVAYAQLKKQS